MSLLKMRGRCGCGALSPLLPSQGQRRRWHREHREQVAGVPWVAAPQETSKGNS